MSYICKKNGYNKKPFGFYLMTFSFILILTEIVVTMQKRYFRDYEIERVIETILTHIHT